MFSRFGSSATIVCHALRPLAFPQSEEAGLVLPHVAGACEDWPILRPDDLLVHEGTVLSPDGGEAEKREAISSSAVFAQHCSWRRILPIKALDCTDQHISGAQFGPAKPTDRGEASGYL
jgi:hypothetical protein